MEEQNNVKMPDNFRIAIIDFTKDLSITFPEYVYLWEKWYCPTAPDAVYEELFQYCMTVYPERFFDILYQNEEMFSSSEVNTFFLPDVDFEKLYHCENITENTKQSLWKYLQLILLTISGSIKDKSIFGAASDLFDGINENDLHSKMSETMSGISDFFSKMGMDKDEEPKDGEQPFTFEKTNGMPNMDDLHGHLKGMFDGKIGRLAKELAEEITKDISDILGEDMGEVKSSADMIKKMIKNPKKIMELVKTVSTKLNTKMKNGDISQEELMKEASEIMQKMKNMGGGEQFGDMMKNLAKTMGKNVRVDSNAMDRMTKQTDIKTRIRSKLIEKQAQIKNNQLAVLKATEHPNHYVYIGEGDEKQEKSVKKSQQEMDEQLISELQGSVEVQTNNKKEKSKKKKSKK